MSCGCGGVCTACVQRTVAYQVPVTRYQTVQVPVTTYQTRYATTYERIAVAAAISSSMPKSALSSISLHSSSSPITNQTS